MIKQYKLRFYNFRLVIFLLAISTFGIILVGSAREDLRSKQLAGRYYRFDHYDNPFVDGLFMDFELSVDYVWHQYCSASDRASVW